MISEMRMQNLPMNCKSNNRYLFFLIYSYLESKLYLSFNILKLLKLVGFQMMNMRCQ